MEPIQEVNRERLGSTLVSSVVHRRATPGAGMFSGCGKTGVKLTKVTPDVLVVRQEH